MEVCPKRTLSCVALVFLGYQEICTIKYLQNETTRGVGGGCYYKETNNLLVCIYCSKDHP